MAPFIASLLALLALVSTVVASPHMARHRAHRAVDLPQLNKRCSPRPSNTTSSLPSVPLNVAPSPSLPPASIPDSASSPYPTLSPSVASQPPSPTPSSPTPTPTPAPSSPSPSPAPSTSSTPPPATSTAPPPAQTSSSDSGEPSFMVGVQTGQLTNYDTGLGACGIVNNESQFIAAVSHLLFDAFPNYNGVNPNTNPVCNRRVQITYGGNTITVVITDRCDACGITDLDLSQSAFAALAPLPQGRLFGAQWVWA